MEINMRHTKKAGYKRFKIDLIVWKLLFQGLYKKFLDSLKQT